MAPSRSRASGVSSHPTPASTSLPVYQSPAHPLNEKAQQSLRHLPQTHKLGPLKDRLKVANDLLTAAATDINDRLYANVESNAKRKARRDAQGLDDEEDVDGELNQKKKTTREMTEKLDQRVRENIDASEAVKRVEEALKNLDSNIAAAASSRGGATQSTLGASQFRSGRPRNGGGGGDEDDEDEEEEEEDSTADLGASQPPKSALVTLKQRVKEDQVTYQNLSMTDRYSTHTDYVGFRKMVHDARYPAEEAPPLPHASTWFTSDVSGSQRSSDNALANSQRTLQNDNNNNNADDDDDVAIATERISVKCPITLTEMRDPVSSTKCPHNFERSAILDMISLSTDRIGGDGPGSRGGEKAMRCPQAGCDVILAASDLHTNPILIRKIKRAQAALAQSQNDDIIDDDDDDDEVMGPRHHRKHKNNKHQQYFTEAITSSPAAPLPSRVKNELRSQRTPRPLSKSRSVVPETQYAGDTNPESVPPPSTAAEVVDLEDEDDEDDDDDDEDEDDE